MRDRIKNYQILRQIGTGGFGEVYVARQDFIDRDVAIKVILPVHANQDDFIERFQVEASLVARLEHPHIVPLFDFWRDPQGAYLVMRYIRGGNLADYLVTHGALDLQMAATLLQQIAGALHIAHQKRIVHQDIKPANILLDENNNAYLTDFGIARDIEGGINLAEDASNTMHGSPKYISPESLRRQEITHRTDIYSLGVLMYELLTGSPPFMHDDLVQLLKMQIKMDLPPLKKFRDDLPKALNQPLYQATMKDPLQRYDSVLQFAQDFQAVITQQDARLLAPKQVLASQPEAEITGILGEVSNPYKGLEAFQEGDADLFFGRDRLVASLRARMTETGMMGRFLAVVGPSGSGKSSVVRAGLLPTLRDRQLSGLPKQYITTMTPGSDPMRSLEGAILKVAKRDIASILETLATDDYDLAEVLQQILPDQGDMLLLIDQFEEVFTLTSDEASRRQFLGVLYRALTQANSRMRLIVTLRADYLARPLEYVEWGAFFRERMELVPPMTAQELQDAIEKPAKKNGLDFEEGLVSRLIADMQEQRGALPLLQYTLDELYQRREGSLELSHATYDVVGGIRGALAKRAQTLYDTLDTTAQAMVRLIFTRLVRVGSQGTTRRRVTLRELYSLTGDSDLIQQILDHYGNYRLLTFDHDISTRAPTVEIAHEALIESWGLFKNWVEENIDALRLQTRLSAQVRQWHDAAQDSSFLARGAQLDQYRSLTVNPAIILTKREQEYMNASLHAQVQEDHRRRRRQQVLAGLMALIVLFGVAAVILAWVANRSRQSETEARNRAEENADIARARELAAASLLFAENAPDTALLLSMQSLAVTDDFEGQNALLTALMTQRRLVGYLYGHEDIIRASAVSHDGDLWATGSRDGDVIVWDAETRTIRGQFSSEDGRINGLAFAPDDKTLVAVDEGGQVLVWDVLNNTLIQQVTVNDGELRAAVYSADGTWLAVAGAGGDVILLETDKYREVARLNGHGEDVIYALASHPDANLIASGSADQSIVLWDLETLALQQRLEGHTNWVFALAFAPDGRSLASTGADRSVRLWDVQSGDPLWAFRDHEADVFALTFSQDGRLLLSGDAEGRLDIWAAANGNIVQRLDSIGHYSVRTLATQGNRLLVAGDQATPIIMSIRFEPPLGTVIAQQEEPILVTAIHADGQVAYSGGVDDDFAVSVLHPDTDTVQRLVYHTGGVHGLAWHGDYLISSSLDTRTAIWSGETVLRELRSDDSVFSLAISDDVLALGLNDGTIELWQITAATPDAWTRSARLTAHRRRVTDLAFNGDGTRLVSVGLDEQLIIWDVAEGTLIAQAQNPHTDRIQAVAYHPQQALIATGSRDNTILLWDADTANVMDGALAEHENWVNDLAFTHDGNFLISVSNDRSVILWRFPEARNIGSALTGHTNWVNTLSISADDRYLVTGGRDGQVMRWEIDLDTWHARACAIATRPLNASERRDYFSLLPPAEDICD